MTTASTELPVVLARLEIKLDTLIKASGDHESRLRELEGTQKSGKALAMTITNTLMTLLTTAMASTTVIGR